MLSHNDNHPEGDPEWRYAGWIIGGLFAVVVIAAAIAFLAHDPKIAAKAPAAAVVPKTSTTGAATE